MSKEPEIAWRTEPSRPFNILMPERVIESIESIARYKDTTCEALIRLYIGVGLRDDLARYFDEQVLTATEAAIAKRLPQQDVAAVMQEVRSEFREQKATRPRTREVA